VTSPHTKSHDQLGRRCRTRPQSTGKRITLQPRDWLWLDWLHQHGPLASSFLLEAAKDYGSSEKRAIERLADLFHEDNTVHGGTYLKRPPQQFATIDSRYNQLVYDLAPAGERALKETGLWRPKHKAATGPWLHSFMVSSITASIRLAADARSDLEYIPQAYILERANADLSWPVSFVEPTIKKQLTKHLKPDALFGLEYKTEEGSRYRFFVVEADRTTEPLTSRNINRKSMLRNLLQYEAYIRGEKYKKHLKLTAPLLVLNVFSDEQRMRKTMELVEKQSADGCPYMLFQWWEAFAPPFRIPQPSSSFISNAWLLTSNRLLSIAS